tara:strand:- start:1152 stop:1322 length:171 start_codon:yes stop_codon:yes gene_type:complete
MKAGDLVEHASLGVKGLLVIDDAWILFRRHNIRNKLAVLSRGEMQYWRPDQVRVIK